VLRGGLAVLKLYAAIDILEGKAVRLHQGDFARRTVYGEDPLEAARRWVSEGARCLHVVDLDGAKRGEPVSLDHLRRIASALGEETDVIEHGGGLRSAAAAQSALEAGADRVVVGTAAFTDPTLLQELLSRDRDRLAVAIDARAGRVTVGGWLEGTQQRAEPAISALAEGGVQTIIYTDVDQDGTLQGVSAPAVARLCQAAGTARLVYSGGIGSVDDLRELAELGAPNLEGVIVGKALYEERFSVGEAQEALAVGQCS
jgi:phosphoribosylformimino-5-aminoimidazole carboxamide ribotide isomerase